MTVFRTDLEVLDRIREYLDDRMCEPIRDVSDACAPGRDLAAEMDRLVARFDDAPLFAHDSGGELRSGVEWVTPVNLCCEGLGFMAHWKALDSNRLELRLRGPFGQLSRTLIFQWEAQS